MGRKAGELVRQDRGFDAFIPNPFVTHPATFLTPARSFSRDSRASQSFIKASTIATMRFGPAHGVAIHENPAIGDVHFFPDLVIEVPPA